jgi:hypothetical protein
MAEEGARQIMKPNKLTSTILATVLCLCGMSRHAYAQQSASSSGIAAILADAPSQGDVSTLFVRALKPRRAGFSLTPSSHRGSMTAAAAASSDSAVHGSGTVGKIPLWTAIRPNGDSVLGDSIMTELNGNIGIGLSTPMSKLSVQGMIETTLGGYKFPDGTVQTTAATSGLQSVIHDATLMGEGTSGSPLQLAVPLHMNGAVLAPDSLVVITNTANGGNGVAGVGGSSNNFVGGIGVFGNGGDSNGGFGGGPGLFGRGGNSAGGAGAPGEGVLAIGGASSDVSASGGIGLRASGGFGTAGGTGAEISGGSPSAGTGGIGIRAFGGFSHSHAGGVGIEVAGGSSNLDAGGNGIIVTGGTSHSATGENGGEGVVANGGDSLGKGGNGVVAIGGGFNGRGVVATGGIGSVGYGVEATGGASTGSGSTAGAGVFAKGGPSSGPNSESGFGIIAIAGDATNGAMRGRAGAFQGDVTISDNLTVSGNLDVQGSKHFKIDHPLDPENKYLIHASIESSQVLNLYSGNVVTDAKGNAIVTLPDWFEALNSDLRYQLTVVGTFAQAIVAEKVKQNRFTIRTSAPNVEVSWQVTGVRSDRMMQQHPFNAVEDKPERERGTYINPELYNQPDERGVEWARNPEMMRQLQQRRIELEQTAKQRKPAGR